MFFSYFQSNNSLVILSIIRILRDRIKKPTIIFSKKKEKLNILLSILVNIFYIFVWDYVIFYLTIFIIFYFH